MRQPTNHESTGLRKASTRDQNKQCRELLSVERGGRQYISEKKNFLALGFPRVATGREKIREEPFYKGAQSFNIGIFKTKI